MARKSLISITGIRLMLAALGLAAAGSSAAEETRVADLYGVSDPVAYSQAFDELENCVDRRIAERAHAYLNEAVSAATRRPTSDDNRSGRVQRSR